MKRILYILICLPVFGFGQQTYVPDDNFEQELINLGVDFVLDDYVITSGIDTITVLYINNLGINDLKGIEDFIALRELFCYSNQISSLDLSNNSNLFEVSCGNNQLISLNLRNGNNLGLWYFMSMNNPSLNCIDVDDVAWADYNWAKDTWTTFSTNCGSVSVTERIYEKRLLNVVDIYGNKVIPKPNIPLLYIFDDGTVEKRFFVD